MGINIEDQEKEAETKRIFRRIGWLLILWFFLGALLAIILSLLFKGIPAAILTIISISAAYIPFFFYRGKQTDLWQSGEEFDGKTFFKWLTVVLTFNVLFMILWTPLASKIVELFGGSSSTMISEMNSMQLPRTFDMIFYIGLLGPFFEELVYRGVILRNLEQYGRSFAIVASAMLFGFMHMNLLQIPMAMGLGLIFGYLALRYSLRFSILLHMFNNTFVLAVTIVLAKGNEMLVVLFGLTVISIFASAGYLLLKNWRAIWEAAQSISLDTKMIGKFLTSLPISLFFLMAVGVTIFSIMKH